MKKNFFKKLSFVLALAMIIATIAPAAGAFAATALHLNSTKRYLYLGGVNEFDFNISHATRGSKAAWLSSDVDVAEVDETTGYVTGTGLGTATISVDVTAKDGTVTPLEATVVVRDNIKTINTIYCQTDANQDLTKLAVGKDYDFGRTFTTDADSTTATSSKTVWTVNSTKATISSLGVFNATEAGDYTITALAFQSTDKANAWKAAVAKDATSTLNVLASKTLAVKVVVDLTKVELVKPTQLKLTFDSSVKDIVKTKADVVVNLKLDGTYTAMVPVASLDSVSEDGKVVTVSTYDALVNTKTYKVTAAGVTKELLAQIGTPVSISMVDQTAPVGAYTVKFALIDQYGVDVSSMFVGSVSKSSSLGWTNQAAGTLTLSNGQVAFVNFSYDIIKADGSIQTISTGTKSVTCVAASYTGAFEWNLNTSASNTSAEFNTADTSIAIGETSYLHGRGKQTDNSYIYTGYRFESMNPSLLVVDTATGAVTPLAVGSALVKALDVNSNVVSYFNVTISAESATSFVKASNTTVKLSNGYDVLGVSTLESTTVDIKNVNQYAVESTATIDTTACYVANATRTQDIATISFGAGTITFTAVATKSGSFVYVVKTSEGKSCTINVTVATPGNLSTYAIEANQASIDSYVANTDTVSAVNFTVYGVDANGFKKSLAVTGGGVSVTYSVAGPVDFTENLSDANADGTVTFDLDDKTDTGAENGAYTFKVSIGGIIYTKSFTVVNTRPAPEVVVNAVSVTVANSADLYTVLNNLLDVKIGGVDQTILGATFVSGNTTLLGSAATTFAAATDGTVNVFVRTVTFTAADGATVTVDINRNFVVTVQ